ncbi:MAG: ATP-binding cassette domain-containing protein [Gemmatimonadetes bacterium]|nr:ATP-binding cassette domain-containing protein [Gemmatimonadota bacterium]
MIRARGLRLDNPRPTPGARERLLDGIDLDIREGEYIALVGPNGAGKTLLLQLLGGLRSPDAGEVAAPAPLADGSGGLASVFQSPDDQIVGSTVERDLAFGLENRAVPSAEIRRRVEEALDWSGLRTLARRPPHLLSEGEKQRLALASALVLRPAVLLLDEPTARLDAIARERFFAEIERVRSERPLTVVHVTHRADEAERADRVVALAAGRVEREAAGAEIDRSFVQERLISPTTFWRMDTEPLPLTEDPEDPSVRERMTIVRAEAVSVRAEPAGEILRSVDLELRTGETVGLVGMSGAGKTTLLSVLAGLLEPTSGRVTWHRNDRSSVGLVFQEPERAFFEATVLEDVAFGARNRGLSPDEAHDVAREALARVGLDPQAIGPRLPESLSGGEARRAAIAGILAFAPRAVAFDEPTTGLDVEGVHRLQDVLGRLRADGVALALASHERDFVEAECERAAVLADGTLRWSGDVDDLADHFPVR